jgi:Peptidase M50B-like
MYAMHAPLPETHTVLPGTQTPLPGNEAALVGLAALAIVMTPFLWPLVEHFNAMAHEGAHAIVGFAMGFTVAGVRLDMESNGGTAYDRAPDRGPRRTLTRFVGYLGPSAFGLCAAKLIETGHVISVLWAATILLVLLLFLVRKSFAIVSVPAAIALLAVVMRYAHDRLEEVIVYGMTWLLLLSGVRVAAAHGAGARDAENLSRTTHIPRRIWALLWLAGTLLAVVIGWKWLVLRS